MKQLFFLDRREKLYKKQGNTSPLRCSNSLASTQTLDENWLSEEFPLIKLLIDLFVFSCLTHCILIELSVIIL